MRKKRKNYTAQEKVFIPGKVYLFPLIAFN